ncbi:putative RNA-binding protein Luc7-like 1 [Cichlidogyrus casuarinus]|uniref:RNA-binding protein Luc7-like 1 n=1 Tax=Cichlidogyrus casuarinus TaxID=1844966 RepID=A0ABD2QEP1_9PLAT
MSASDQMRAMLDELMGTNRDGLDNNTREISFDDPQVCKSYLLDCCPHEILSGTRMDLGECHYIHDPALKADFRRESEKRDFYFELEALSHLESFISDCDKKVELAKNKLSETQEELTDEALAKSNHISHLGEKIGTKLAKADELAGKGEVDQSLGLMKEVEELSIEKTRCEAELKTTIPMSTYQQQKLRVCEACSAYLGIHDNDRRLADHFGGKLHLGFMEIRDKLEHLRKTCEDRNLVEKRREAIMKDRRSDREIISGSLRGRSRSRSRDRDRRTKHRRSRSRSRSHARRKEKKSRRYRSRSRS